MVTIGQEFRTGERCIQSGVYGFVRHTSNVGCSVTPAEREIPLSIGETFPPIRSCNHGAVWRLVRFA